MDKLFSFRFLAALGVPAAGRCDAANQLRPIMCVEDKVALQDDFSKPGALNKQQWAARQGTQWTIEDGVLRGRPSTPEHRASAGLYCLLFMVRPWAPDMDPIPFFPGMRCIYREQPAPRHRRSGAPFAKFE